jgi:uncharacterized membrane protein YhaH (DUF805 family)
MKHYIHAFNNYANFKGRASRSNYFLFAIFNFLFALAAIIIDSILGISLLYPIYVLGTIVPSIAILVRRLHDINKSGWWYFIALIPLVGVVWLFVLLLTKGTDGVNNYGAENEVL